MATLLLSRASPTFTFHAWKKSFSNFIATSLWISVLKVASIRMEIGNVAGFGSDSAAMHDVALIGSGWQPGLCDR